MMDTSLLTEAEQRLLWRSLVTPVGIYSTRRAAQLAGIPARTVSDWAAAGILQPDYPSNGGRSWSYRDLVLVRFVGWLRAKSVNRDKASERAAMLKAAFKEDSDRFSVVRGDGTHIFYGAEDEDRWTGQRTFAEFASGLLDVFQLDLPRNAEGLGSRRSLWGPHLIRPSDHIRILPWVMAGEPCIVSTRIPTAALAALVNERGLSVPRVVDLYPGLSGDAVEEAVRLERSVREHKDYLSDEVAA